MWALACLDVCCHRLDGSVILDHINLSLKQQESVALLGLNGAGKTTLIRVLAGLCQKSSGKVIINGCDMDHRPRLVRESVSVVTQHNSISLFDTVEDVVLNAAGYAGISRKKAKLRAQMLLNNMRLYDCRSRRAYHLSGGMKRRLMLVCALITNPSLLILDEPTAGVDAINRRLIWDYLKQLNEAGVSILLASHDCDEIALLCQRLVVLSCGRIVSDQVLDANSVSYFRSTLESMVNDSIAQ